MDFDFSVKGLELETDRLLIRPWKADDLQDFHQYASVPGVGEMAGWHHHRSLEETQYVLQGFMAKAQVFALQHKADKKVIGSLGVHELPHSLPPLYENRYAKEIGYALDKNYWGIGLMVEAVISLIDYLFNYTEANLLVCCCMESNRQSRRVMEKAGFVFSRRFNRRRDLPSSEASFEFLLTKEAYDASAPVKVSFENDYNRGCHPQVMEALIKTNERETSGYGLDPYSDKARALIRQACQADHVDVHFCVGGTQANLLVAAGALKPWQGVISAETGHINVHEAGAVEATGHKVLVLPSKDGLLSASVIDDYCRSLAQDPTAEHMVQAGMIYLSQPTELGTLYRKEDLQAIRQVADRWGLILYVDGARLASALASPEAGMDLADLASLAHVFTIGGTKCGALFGEALVIGHEPMKKDFRSLIKQRGALLAKGRLLGVQFMTLMSQDLYGEIGRWQNERAREMVRAFEARGIDFYAPPQTNQLFVILNAQEKAELARRASFETILSLGDGRTVCRFVTSYASRSHHIHWLFA